MNISAAKKIIPKLIKHDVVPWLHGRQGIGKTQVVQQVAKELGVGFMALYPATQEVGDLLGLQEKEGKGSVHLRPEWFPTEGEGILFIDEINRAHPDVVQAMFSLVTGKKIHTHVLPPGWKIVVAGNYNNSRFNVTDMSDDAWLSRFCHLDFQPTIEEFIAFTESQGKRTVADFIREQRGCLESIKKENTMSFDFVTPDRRSWNEMIGPLEKEDLGDDEFEVYQGIIGTAAAAAFIQFKQTQEKGIALRDILNGYGKTVRKRVLECSKDGDARFDLLSQAAEELMANIKQDKLFLTPVETKVDSLERFMLDVPLELLSKMVSDISSTENFRGKQQILSNSKIAERLRK
jgi:alkaline phosphatase D